MKILMSYKHFPMCGGNFFKWAMEVLGHEVFSVGSFSGDKIPWNEDLRFPSQYIFPPDLQLPDEPMYPLKEVLKKLPWKPDLILQIDAGFYLWGNSPGIPNAMFATDPHFLDYTTQYHTVDYFFNPQPSTFHKYPKGIFLPWAYDPNIHRVMNDIASDKEYDIVFIGLLYEQREKALKELSKRFKVFYSPAGIIYDECTEIYNKGKISFNWSSNNDIPMRIFEGMAYGNLVLTNRITGMNLLSFKENKHYVGYDNLDELLQKTEWILSNEEKLDQIACNGYVAVEEHTYKERCKTILRTIFKDES